jgi:transposase
VTITVVLVAYAVGVGTLGARILGRARWTERAPLLAIVTYLTAGWPVVAALWAGAPWRDLPPGYPPWPTVYGLFRRWQLDGTWAGVLAGLQARADAAGLITGEVPVDSTTVRAPACGWRA